MAANSDLQKWQQTINGITVAQSELSPEELSAVSALVTFLNNGNFESSENDSYIQVIKNALPQHVKNRLLHVHLKNFVALCEKHFKVQPTAANINVPPSGGGRETRQTSTSGKTKNSGGGLMQKIIVIGIVLAAGYFPVKNSEWFNNLFSKSINTGITAAGEKVNDVGHADEQQSVIDSMTNLIDSLRNMKTAQSDVQEIRPIPGPDISYRNQSSYNSNSAFPGRFPQASERLLTDSDLRYLSKNDLKIMRNEIFARYGYIFQTTEMKQYFQNQSWYTPQRSDVTDKLSNIEIKNIDLIKRYENNATDSGSTKGVPPIENTNRYNCAWIALPKKWDGKSILANNFVWIGENDKKLQDKYNVHPGDIYQFNDDHEIWDDDDTYYKYPLSPDVVIEAGAQVRETRKMTVNEFADYMRRYNVIAANITYKNKMITKIVEQYTP